MINQEIILYIQAQIAAGMPKDVIREMLVTRGGWRSLDVEEAFKRAVPPPAPVPVPKIEEPAPIRTTPAPVNLAPTPAPVIPPTAAPVSTPTPTPTPTATSPASQFTLVKGMMGSPEPAAPLSTSAPAPLQKPSLEEEIRSQVPEIKMVTPTPTPTPAQPPITQIPAPAPMPVIEKPITVSAPIISDIKPAIPPGVSPYQPTRIETPTGFVGMQSDAMAVRMTENTVPKRSGKRIALVATLLLLVLILGGGGAYGYFFYINPSPALAFKRAIPTLESAKTGHFKATITATFNKSLAGTLIPIPNGLNSPDQGVQISENPTATATIAVDGTFDRTDSSNQKSVNTLTFTTSLMPLNVSLETRLLSGTFYAKVPDLGFLSDLVGGNTFGFLPGDWVELSKSDLAGLSQASAGLTGVAIDPTMLGANLTAAQEEQISKLFLESGVITPTIELSKQDDNGVSVHRYQFSVNQQALKQAVTQSALIVEGGSAPTVDSSSIDQFLNTFTVTDGELWIGVWDGKPYKMLFTIKPVGDLASQIQSIAVSVDLDSFGKAVSITAPDNAKPLLPLLADAQKKSKDAQIASTLGMVKAEAEIYYAKTKSYLGICAGATGLSMDMINLNKAVAPATAYCKDAARSFAIAAPLVSVTGVSCADSTGTVATLAMLPTGTACK